MIKKVQAQYELIEGGRDGAVEAANELVISPQRLRKIGITAVDDRVLWTAGETGLTFYYREQEEREE